MKKNTIKDLQIKSIKELKEMLPLIGKELADLRINQATKKQKNVKESKFKRIEIARIKTIIRKKELEETNG